MQSKLLIHPLISERTKESERLLEEQNLKIGHPDVLWMDDEKLGVEQAKKIRGFLSFKPYSAKGRAVVVLNADNLTLDAQNALLKTLEEPPLESVILLGAESDKKILPTVLSRCEVIVITSHKRGDPKDSTTTGIASTLSRNDEITKLVHSTSEERFEFIEKLEDKEVFLDELIIYFHSQLTANPSSLTTSFAKELLHAEEWKEANGNIRAILEYLMLKMPKSPG